MNPAPDRRALYWLFLAGSGAVGPLVPTLPLWLTAVIVVCAGWRYAIDLYAWPRPGWFLRLGLTVVLTVAVFLQFRTILGHHAGVALLVGLLGLKFLELRSLRDYFLSLFLFYLVLLGAYLQEQSLLLGIWSLVVVVASLAALIHVTQPQGLALGARLRLAGLLVLKALPLMLVVYLLFPRIQGTLWGLPTVTPSALTGLSEVMRPGSINDLSESTAPAFRVTFEGAMPPLRTLYWRGLVLTATDGRAWFRRAPELNEEVDAFQGLGDPVSYTVTLEPSNKPWLPALDLPAEVPPGSRYQYGYVLEHAAPVRERLTYSTSSHTRYRTPALKPEERELHLELPKTTSARVRALADSWQRENSSPLAVVQSRAAAFPSGEFCLYPEAPAAWPGPGGRVSVRYPPRFLRTLHGRLRHADARRRHSRACHQRLSGGRGQRRRELHPRAPGRRPRLGRGLDRGVRLDARGPDVGGGAGTRRARQRGAAAAGGARRGCGEPVDRGGVARHRARRVGTGGALYAPLLGHHQFLLVSLGFGLRPAPAGTVS